jgi:cholesterol transport system auxiliary component
MITQSPPRSATCRRFWAAALVLSIFGILFAGCLSKPALKRQTFAFDNPPASNATFSKSGGVVALQSVEISALFNHRSFTYRTSAEAYEIDPYAGFLVAPSRAVAIAIRAWLLNSGRFQDVVEPGSQITADKSLHVYVSELYGDFTKPDQAAAVLSLKMDLFKAGTDKKDRPVILQKDYSRRVPIIENTAAAIMAGWNKALTEIMTEASSDIATAQVP